MRVIVVHELACRRAVERSRSPLSCGSRRQEAVELARVFLSAAPSLPARAASCKSMPGLMTALSLIVAHTQTASKQTFTYRFRCLLWWYSLRILQFKIVLYLFWEFFELFCIWTEFEQLRKVCSIDYRVYLDIRWNLRVVLTKSDRLGWNTAGRCIPDNWMQKLKSIRANQETACYFRKYQKWSCQQSYIFYLLTV